MRGVRVTGVKQACDRLDKRIASYQAYFEAVLNTALDSGKLSAEIQYANGEQHAPIICMKDPAESNGKTITGRLNANGLAVVFFEFGAGDLAGAGDLGEQQSNFEMETGIAVYPGSYSETIGSGEYAEMGYWHFNGIRYEYIEPRRGMYHAGQTIRTELGNTDSQCYTSNEAILGGG